MKAFKNIFCLFRLTLLVIPSRALSFLLTMSQNLPYAPREKCSYQDFFWSAFPAFRLNTERYEPEKLQILQKTQKNSEKLQTFHPVHIANFVTYLTKNLVLLTVFPITQQTKNILKTFTESQFSCCLVMWMFYSGTFDNKINQPSTRKSNKSCVLQSFMHNVEKWLSRL